MVGRYHKGDFTKGMLLMGACTVASICLYKVGFFKNERVKNFSKEISTLGCNGLVCILGAIVLLVCPMEFVALTGREYLAWAVEGAFCPIYFAIFGDTLQAIEDKKKGRIRTQTKSNGKGRKSQGARRALSNVHNRENDKIKGKEKI